MLQVEPSLLDTYGERQSCAQDNAGILQMKFVEFVSQYFVKDSCLKKGINLLLFGHFQHTLLAHKAQTVAYSVNISC